MKKTIDIIAIVLITTLAFVACAQESTKEKQHDKSKVAQKEIMEKEKTLEMSQDTLDARVVAEMEAEIIKRKVELTAEALATIAQTENLLYEIAEGKTDEAIKKGKELIGELEVLLAKDPSLALLPVDVRYEKQELITDIESVREGVKQAKEAMEKGYYREASDILKDLRSEMVINTYLIPTATYPEAIRKAVLMLEDKDTIGAVVVLQEVLGTVAIERSIIPLPVMYAEQMVIEAAVIDAKDHEHIDIVLNLLNNADYQLRLAEEMGYGKRDKDFASLSEAIKTLKESVSNKENSEDKFGSLKEELKKFKEKLLN